jgi:hypothetical protein
MSSTPGPWVWKQLDYDQPHVPEFTLDGPDVLCRYWRDERPSANALLIAAAPILLKALQDIVETAPMVTRGDVERDARARAAIAMATGVSSS